MLGNRTNRRYRTARPALADRFRHMVCRDRSLGGCKVHRSFSSSACFGTAGKIPFGPTPEHKGYGSGYVNILHSVHEEYVYFVLVSLAEQGFRTIVIWRGCGEHQLHGAVDRFNARFRSQRVAYLPSTPYHDIWLRVGDPAVPCGHADRFATSIALYRRPEAVRRDEIPPPNSGNVDWADPHLDFTKYSQTGVIGDATQASAELGRMLWNEVISITAAIFRDVMVENGLKGRMRMGESCST